MGRKNVFGGNKAKKKKRIGTKQEVVDALDTSQGVFQMYGQITECINVRHYTILCTDNKSYLGRLCGKMKRGRQLQKGLYVVVSLREFEGDKKTCDVMAFAKPPQNIIEQFKINNPVKYDIVDFCNSDDDEADNEGFVNMKISDKPNVNFDDMTGDDLNNMVDDKGKNRSNVNRSNFNNRNESNVNNKNNCSESNLNNSRNGSNFNNGSRNESNFNNSSRNESNFNNSNRNESSFNNSNRNGSNFNNVKNSDKNICNIDNISYESDSEESEEEKVYKKDKFGNDIIESGDESENSDEEIDPKVKVYLKKFEPKIAKKHDVKQNVILYDEQEDAEDINFDDI